MHNIEMVQNAYSRYARCYDLLFGKIFQHGRKTATDLINAEANQNDKILEVGVGTGISVFMYRDDLHVTGIDVSKKMLDIAKSKLDKNGKHKKIDLIEMDAENLAFQDNSFDFVIAMYVVSVVPNINKFLDEITRVCAKNGHIIILNHFSSENKLLNIIEKKLTSFQKILGFRPDFPIEKIMHHPNMELINKKGINIFKYWQLLHFKKIAEAI